MKTLKLIMVLILALFVFSGCENDPIDEELLNEESTELSSKKALKSKLQNKVIESVSLMGNFVGNSYERKLQVYTPPGYRKNGDHAYPVVYLLHGFPFSEKAFIDPATWDEWITPYLFTQEYPDFPEKGFRLWIDKLISEGTIEPMIIVMPNSGTDPYGFSMYSNSVLNGNFEDFIVSDLVEYMDNRYNTIPDASGRAIIGHSQGGYAAFKLGMLHNETFGTVASHSGLLFVDALFGLTDVIALENPDGFTGPDPTKFFTSATYAFSAAWSPNLQKPPFFVDLPFEFQDEQIVLVPEVIERWHENDVFNLLDTYHEEFNSLDGIYFDVGFYDEIGTHMAHEPVIAKLNGLNIDYTFETYPGGHHTHMFERLARALEFCSNSMQ
ncbi:MAG: esterase family protein [Flavobacteriaceae bacterium]|nr:esterase family protein [Flavobacteriaceae bacterium]